MDTEKEMNVQKLVNDTIHQLNKKHNNGELKIIERKVSGSFCSIVVGCNASRRGFKTSSSLESAFVNDDRIEKLFISWFGPGFISVERLVRSVPNADEDVIINIDMEPTSRCLITFNLGLLD